MLAGSVPAENVLVVPTAVAYPGATADRSKAWPHGDNAGEEAWTSRDASTKTRTQSAKASYSTYSAAAVADLEALPTSSCH